MNKAHIIFNRDFKMPHLFREDIEGIEEIIKSLSPKDYSIETREFKYGSINDIPDSTKNTSCFRIIMDKPNIFLYLDRWAANLSSNEGDLKVFGAVSKIAEIIAKRERKVLYYSQILFFLVFILILLFPTRLFVHDNIRLLEINYTSAFVGVICLALIFKQNLKNFSIVEFKGKKDRPNFLSRKKDDIIMLFIGAIIGLSIPVLYNFIIGLFIKK